MFIDALDFPWTGLLESHWESIRREYLGLAGHQLMPWPERSLYKEGWSVFGLWAFGQRLEDNCRCCPATATILESIPELTTAGFSVLSPGTTIKPHVGYTDSVVRCHLGLIVPDGCALQVGDDVRCSEEGKCLVFGDTTLHSAWNHADSARVVLLVDCLRAGREFDPKISAEAADAVANLTSRRSDHQ